MSDNQFAADVRAGLSASPKYLLSKYFYDEAGDALFQQIMELDEYYLTRAELSIFEKQADQILSLLHSELPFRVVELGAGDGFKTKVLLQHWMERKVDFSYSPVDISANALKILKSKLSREIPSLRVEGLHGDYFKVLSELKFRHDCRNVVFFLGSNIGNFRTTTTLDFLTHLRENLNPGDMTLIGFDLKKEPDRILRAYNDASGVTKAFNLNLLRRINHELAGTFDADTFEHYPIYDPASGECRSYLVSKADQSIRIEAIEMDVHFQKWEPIFMEVSRKFDLTQIEMLASQSGFRIVGNLLDEEQLFADSIWEAI